jgi:DNA-binding NarL/FixJ family response regulator
VIPRIVVAEPLGPAEEAEVSRLLRRDGHPVMSGFAPPSPRSDAPVVCLGPVRDEVDAEAAVLAAARGAHVIAWREGPNAITDQLCEAFHALGGVHMPTPAELTRELGLTREMRALLDLLAGGCSISESAQRLHLSRRTATRRLAEARRVLDVNSTAEALVAFHAYPRAPAGTDVAQT